MVELILSAMVEAPTTDLMESVISGGVSIFIIYEVFLFLALLIFF